MTTKKILLVHANNEFIHRQESRLHSEISISNAEVDSLADQQQCRMVGGTHKKEESTAFMN
jgi:hypothetical protein